MQWTYHDFKIWKTYTEQKGRSDIEDKLRRELQPHGRQQLVPLIEELIRLMGFEEDMIVMRGKPPRTYAQACEELVQCLGSMKTDERNDYHA